MKTIFSVCAALALSACVQFSEGGRIEDKHTGFSGFHSGEFDLSAQSGVFVSGDIVTSGDGTYGVVSRVVVPGTKPVGIQKAFSNGSEIYVTSRGVDFNCGGSGCTASEDFTLLLSPGHVSQGTTSGMEMKVIGRNGAFLMKIPPEAFLSLRSAMAQ